MLYLLMRIRGFCFFKSSLTVLDEVCWAKIKILDLPGDTARKNYRVIEPISENY